MDGDRAQFSFASLLLNIDLEAFFYLYQWALIYSPIPDCLCSFPSGKSKGLYLQMPIFHLASELANTHTAANQLCPAAHGLCHLQALEDALSSHDTAAGTLINTGFTLSSSLSFDLSSAGGSTREVLFHSLYVPFLQACLNWRNQIFLTTSKSSLMTVKSSTAVAL